MRQIVQHARSGDLELLEMPDPGARAGGILVENAVSLISAGTERTAVEFAQRSLLGKAQERPDLVRQVIGRLHVDGIAPTIEAVREKLEQRNVLGYSCAGVVREVGRGAEEFRIGDRVACAGAAYAHHAGLVSVPRNLAVSIPDGVSFEEAAYVTLGAIAMQGVRISAVQLGECVAVVGLGLLGQLTCQILRACGCRVVGIDLDPAKVELARELGAEVAIERADVRAAISQATEGVGADAVLITAASHNNDPIDLAAAICRDRGRVVVVGAVGMELPREPFYLKELELRLSRSYGPGRYDPHYEELGHDYPIGYVRWTERRNMQEFLRLIASGQINTQRLTTHRFPLEEAAEAYRIVTGERKEPSLGLLLTYAHQDVAPEPRVELRSPRPEAGRLGIGMIGAGSFARGVLLPRFAAARDMDLVGLATATGLTARATGQKFGFGYCTTDSSRLLADSSIRAVVITTRHDTHARFVCDALAAGKDVFVEKPLALNEEELEQVVEAYRESGRLLAVGFNRRFSSLAVQLKEAFTNRGPLAIQYRVNAGQIPGGHWIHDVQQGGGRIVGEVCHFVDFVSFLTNSAPVEVFASTIRGSAATQQDTLSIVLQLQNGSLASINYFALGDRSVPKEQVEVFGGGVVGILDDFRSLSIFADGQRTARKLRRQDKGFDQEIAAFAAAVRGGTEPPIPVASLVETTRTTFAIEESIRTRMPVRL